MSGQGEGADAWYERARADEVAQLDRANPHNQELATRLHDALCKLSHTDQCGWLIETGWPDPWERKSAHRDWIDVTLALRGLYVLDRVLAAAEPDVENLARYMWWQARLCEDDEPPVAVGEWDAADPGIRQEFLDTAHDEVRALRGEDPLSILRDPR